MKFDCIATVRRWLGWCLLGLVASASLPAWSQGLGFVCDTVFRQVRSSGTEYLMLQFPTVGTTPVASSPTTAALRSVTNNAGGNSGLNAIGWSPVDNYIYGTALGGGTGDRPRLFRIGQSSEVFVGTVTVPTSISALPGFPAAQDLTADFTSTGGTIDAGGNYYFMGQGGGNIAPSAIYRINRVDSLLTNNVIPASTVYTIRDVAGNTVTIPNMGDVAFGAGGGNPNGELYGATGTTFFRFTLVDSANGWGTATVVTQTVATVGGIGSAFFVDTTDQLYVYDNGTQIFAEVTGFTGTAARGATTSGVYSGVPAAPAISATDGAGCANGGTPFNADLGVTKVYSTLNPPTIVGSTGTFTIVARNNGPRAAFQVQYRDVLPPTLAFVASPPPVATAGTFTTSGNTGTWTISAILPLTTQTLTFTVSVLTAATPTSTSFINTASVLRSLNSPSGATPLPDPVTTNNVATASAVVTASADLRITKTNGTNTLTAGGTTAYTVTVSNVGPYTATFASLRDAVAAGLSCSAVTCTSAVNASCPVPGSVTIALLQSTGILVTLPPSSSLQFSISCGVTATGAWLDTDRWPSEMQPVGAIRSISASGVSAVEPTAGSVALFAAASPRSGFILGQLGRHFEKRSRGVDDPNLDLNKAL